MSDFDRMLCEEVADLWQSRGGDSDGLCFLWTAIAHILKERENNKEGGAE